MRKHMRLAAALTALMLAAGSLAACGGSGSSDAKAPETTAAAAAETTAAETTAEAKETTAAETKAEETKAEETKAEETEAEAKETEAAKEEAAAEAGDAGRYVIWEYEGNGNKVTHDILVAAGMGDTWLELYEDGTGKFNLFQTPLDITWKPGVITVYGTSNYTYEIEGDTLYMDMQGVYYTMKKEGGAVSGGSGSSAGGKASGTAAAAGEPYINDGTTAGVYKLWKFMGLSLDEFSEAFGVPKDQAAEYMQLEIKEDGKAFFTADDETNEVELEIDGEKVVLTADGESMEGTMKDGLITFEMEGTELVLARLTDAAFADAPAEEKGEATVWTGAYTKFVGDEDPAEDEEPFSLELYEDGTGVSHRDGLDLKCSWELDGEDMKMTETFMGMTIDYTGTMDGNELHLFNGDPEDDFTCEYVYTSDGSKPAPASAGAKAEETAAEQPAAERPEGVPGGDGLVSEEEVQKGYVWMSKVAKDIFNTTYEELAEHMGVEGEFDKEEYSEHMGRNKRYYKWISTENPTHFFYVNFDEKDAEGKPGVYTISGFNSSGFSSSEAEAKYLEEVQAEEDAAGKAAAANAAMKDFSVDVHPWGEKEDKVTFAMQIPESGWNYDEAKDNLVENEDINAFGAGFIKFKVEKEVGKFDFYKDKFENYKDIDNREIGGVTFQGRTYKNIGYDWTEYIAQLDDEHAVSIGIVRVDISDGSMGDKILNSIEFK